MDTINTLLAIINKTKSSFIVQDNPSFFLSIKEQII